ncbi:hypothetical protein Dimus_001712, partial [Dionaea muscipula]
MFVSSSSRERKARPSEIKKWIDIEGGVIPTRDRGRLQRRNRGGGRGRPAKTARQNEPR